MGEGRSGGLTHIISLPHISLQQYRQFIGSQTTCGTKCEECSLCEVREEHAAPVCMRVGSGQDDSMWACCGLRAGPGSTNKGSIQMPCSHWRRFSLYTLPQNGSCTANGCTACWTMDTGDDLGTMQPLPKLLVPGVGAAAPDSTICIDDLCTFNDGSPQRRQLYRCSCFGKASRLADYGLGWGPGELVAQPCLIQEHPFISYPPSSPPLCSHHPSCKPNTFTDIDFFTGDPIEVTEYNCTIWQGCTEW